MIYELNSIFASILHNLISDGIRNISSSDRHSVETVTPRKYIAEYEHVKMDNRFFQQVSMSWH